jgi:predicted amidohydrolase YtcJ
MRRLAALLLFFVPTLRAADPAPADLIVHKARVITVDAKFSIVDGGVAIKDGRIVAVGPNTEVLKHRGPKTQVIDAGGKVVMPGLYDSHVHPVGAATSELNEPLPHLSSLQDAFDYIREKTKTTPEGDWIVLWYAFPTRLDEARFPTKAELDKVAPKHPVLYHAGPAGMVNSMALKVSGITKDTKSSAVVKDVTTGEPTGMIRGSYSALKGLPGESSKVTAEGRREAVKKLFALYNQYGLTSVADRNAGRGALDLYLDLEKHGELTVRVNVARSFNVAETREETIKRLEALPGKDGKGGPTGVGDEWVRIGPIKVFLDGGMLNGTAYMREPWPPGPTYQIVENDYRGMLFIKPAPLQAFVEEAAKRKWQVTAHTAGEGAMDNLLDAYESANRMVPIKDLRNCITHANFPSKHNLERCKELGVCADVQPAWFYKDGTTQLKVLGPDRVRWFQPYKSWLEYTTIGGGSDHMIRLDAREATNPWDPWLAIWVALQRTTERGDTINPEERLTREQAIRLYTINNAYLNHEEKEKGSLEVGKLGDLIMVDRNVLTCPLDSVRDTKVLLTVVGGKVVFSAGKEPGEKTGEVSDRQIAEMKWAKEIVLDFFVAAKASFDEQAVSLLASELKKSIPPESFGTWIHNRFRLYNIDSWSVNSEEMSPEKDEVLFRGTFRGLQGEAPFSVRVVKEKDGGKWRIVFYAVGEWKRK